MSYPVTILDLRDSPWLDGPGRTILDCAETIDPARYRVVIGAFDGGRKESTAYEIEARQRGLAVGRIRETSPWDFGVVQQIVALGREHNAALLHTHDFRSDLFGYLAARNLQVPVVATAHGWIQNDWKGLLKSRLDRLILRQASHVVAVSEKTRAQLGGWATDTRCSVIPNALRVEQYHPLRGPGRFRKEHAISSQELLIANIGRLSPEKGQGLFLRAACDLLRENKNLKFVLFGSGPDESRLRKFVADSGISQSVIFAGYRVDMDELYDEIDLVVQSSFTEGMPNVVLEALLMEVPVIATDVGGTREVLKDGETGVLIDTTDRGIVRAVQQFLDNRATFQEYARNGRSDALARFDHRRRVARLCDVYDSVIRTFGEAS